jgi:hypothetical protein
MKNGSATALTATVADSATQAQDLSNSVAFTAGDTMSIRVVPSGTPTTPSYFRWAMVQEITEAQAIYSAFGSTSTNTQYASPFGDANSSDVHRAVIPVAGTLSNLYAKSVDAPGTGDSFIYLVFKNGMSTSLTATISDTATTASDTSNSVAVAAGDNVLIRRTSSGTPDAANAIVSMLFTPDIDGDAIIMGSSDDPLNGTASTTEYGAALFGGVTWGAEDTDALAGMIGGNWTIKNMYARSTVAAGSGDSWDVTLRKGTSDTALTVNLPNTTTSQVVTADVSATTFDQFYMKVVTNGTATGSSYLGWGFLLNEATDTDYTIFKSETATLTESTKLEVENRVNVADTATVSESTIVIIEVDANTVATSDTTTVTDALRGYSDTIHTRESYSVEIAASGELTVSVSDNLTVTESISTETVNRVQVSETVTVSESINVTIEEAGARSVSVGDTTTISESIQRDTTNRIMVSDSIALSESTNVAIETANALSVSVSDNVTVSENVALHVDANIRVSDSATVTEVLARDTYNRVAVSDSITVTESIHGEVVGSSSVSDTATASESVQVVIDAHNLAVSDTTTITESIEVQRSTNDVTVSDTATVNEFVKVRLPITYIRTTDLTVKRRADTDLEVRKRVARLRIVQHSSAIQVVIRDTTYRTVLRGANSINSESTDTTRLIVIAG